MSVTAPPDVEQHGAADPTWAGTPLAEPHWLESPTGFPPGSVAETGLGSATDVLTTARRLTLSRRQVDEVVAFAEFLAGCALPGGDRAELLDDLVDAFEDSPVTATGFLRPLSAGMRRVTSADPIQRATRRLQALTTTWTVEQRRIADGADLNPVMEVVSRHNPLLRHWAVSGVVLVADALTSRLAQHRLVCSLVGAEPESDGALTDRLLARLDEASPAEAADFAAAQVRLLCIRAWLRNMGRGTLDNLRRELDRAIRSALDVDIVVQQVGFRASMAVASAR
ncbi:hypothetical protein [Phytohabitans rumicis]|uniref:Uncharacterized protein n=1 Tax=Phytohabitans rumicis TaxID=1076125 RepID=A0A6V8KSA1_9ACTN|nr:hypothetical protein [Phytohabitans rumicis]GFJ86724.1 hypothetical protein Prum_003660 [Phytohabitans rumicis]